MEKNNKEYHCKRRALVLKNILRSFKTIEEIFNNLMLNNINTTNEEIHDDLKSLKNIGLDIRRENNKYILNEKIIGLNIPKRVSISLETKIEKKKNELRVRLKNINHELLNIIDYSYSRNTSRFFEVYVAKVYKEIANKVYLMGGPSKPDVVVNIGDFSIIIDAKAYGNGFNMPIQERDKMVRYIEEFKQNNSHWVKHIKNNNSNFDKFAFQFVSSSFINLDGKLEDINFRTNINGSAINAENLLVFVDSVLKTKRINNNVFFSNNEIIVL